MSGINTRRTRGRLARSIAVCASAGLVLLAAMVPTSFAAAPNPSKGTAVVDGNPGEWDLTADFFARMTDAGYEDRPTLANLYLRYDCTDEVLYSLVLVVDGQHAQQTRPENAYIRIDGTGKLVSGLSGNDGTPPDFSWVNGDGTFADGFEASGPLAPGSYTVRAHILIDDDSADGYAPVDTVSRDVPLVIDCPTPTPTPTPTATPTEAPTPTPTPTPTGSVSPTATPNPTPTATPTEAPTATPTPTGSVAPTATPNPTGSVSPTGTPTITLPPTDMSDVPPASGDTTGLRIALLALAGVLGLVAVGLPTRRTRPTDDR